MRTLGDGYRHLAMGEVSSTNAECIDFARADHQGNLWITAERQLKGKGSRGRQWVSEKGNLYASLLLRDPGPVDKLATLTFVASLAIMDAIYACANSPINVKLKWPNDVLLEGQKTSGILLESHQFGDARFIIIGIGVNIAHFPAEALYPATSLKHEGIDAAPDMFFQHLTRAMIARLEQWAHGSGFDQTRKDWLANAANLGKATDVKIPIKGETQVKQGTFGGIDEQGLLILKGSNGKSERISVADIFFA